MIRNAVLLISRDGFEGLSIQNLAREAGLSKSGVFAHFKSKEDIQLCAIAYTIAQFKECHLNFLKPEIVGLARFWALINLWQEWIRSDLCRNGCISTRLPTEQSHLTPEVRVKLGEYLSTWTDPLYESLVQAQNLGELSKSESAEDLALKIYAVQIGFHQMGVMQGHDVFKEILERTLRQMLATSKG